MFAERCTRCHACLQNCPQQIIKHNQQGLPVVDFDSGGCTFCAACAESCETGSLSLLAFIGEEPWSLKAKISERCVNYHAGVCRICADVCVAGAITLCVGDTTGALPEVDLDSCTGCGECYRACPRRAISIK